MSVGLSFNRGRLLPTNYLWYWITVTNLWWLMKTKLVPSGSAKANGRESKTSLGQVFNFELGCFDDVRLLIYVDARPHLKLKTQPRFSPVSLSFSMVPYFIETLNYNLKSKHLVFRLLNRILYLVWGDIFCLSSISQILTLSTSL